MQHRKPVDWSHQVVARWSDQDTVLFNGSFREFSRTAVAVRQWCPLQQYFLIYLRKRSCRRIWHLAVVSADDRTTTALKLECCESLVAFEMSTNIRLNVHTPKSVLPQCTQFCGHCHRRHHITRMTDTNIVDFNSPPMLLLWRPTTNTFLTTNSPKLSRRDAHQNCVRVRDSSFD